MLSGLEYVKETIELRKADIQENDFETNNLLMDDILLALGYNKRRNKGVHAVYSGQADWEIEDNGQIRMFIKVAGYGTLDNVSDVEECIDFLSRSDGKFLVITDGQKLSIYNTSGLIITLQDIFSDEAENVLNMISYENWNPSGIEELNSVKIDYDRVVEILTSSENVVLDILNELGITNSDKHRKIIFDTIKNIVNKESETGATEVVVNTEEVDRLNSVIADLQKKLQEQIDLNNELKSGTSDVANEEAYRSKISDLTYKIQHLETDLKQANSTIAEMEKEKAGAEDERVLMARQLMEAVEDNPDLNRTYVGVVNSKLFQIGELPRFIGTCLQELYSAVSFKLMPLLFDGDVFKTVQPAVRNDMMINTKSYDIDITGYTEEELLTKLKVLFSQFSDVVFMCKTIGTIREQPTVIEKQYQSLDTQTNSFDNQGFDNQGFDNQGFDNQGFDNQGFDNQGFDNQIEAVDTQEFEADNFDTQMHDFEENTFDSIPSIDDVEANGVEEEPSVIQNDAVLALALCDIGAVLWDDRSIIKSIKAMANNSSMLKINSNTWDNITAECLSALVALSDNPLETLDRIRITDLSMVSNIIKPLDSCEGNFVQVFDTNYGIEECQNKQIISTIIGIANEIGIPDSSIYMYFNATYINDESLQQNYVQQFELENTLDNAYYEQSTDTMHCLLSGNALDSINDIKGVSDIERRMFKNVVAIRTLSAQATPLLKMTIKTNEDVVTALTTIIESSPDKGAEQIIEKINEKVKHKTPVINRDSKNVSVDAASMTVGNREYFVDTLPGDVLVQMFMCANYEATGENMIDLRVEIDSSLYNALSLGNITSDPYEGLGVGLVLKILEGKTKVLNRR